MKSQGHPQYYATTVRCACGNTFTTGSTLQEITVEICAACHPFFTGQMKYIDTAGRVDKFKMRQSTQGKRVSKTEKRKLKKQARIEQEKALPTTLSDLRSSK